MWTGKSRILNSFPDFKYFNWSIRQHIKFSLFCGEIKIHGISSWDKIHGILKFMKFHRKKNKITSQIYKNSLISTFETKFLKFIDYYVILYYSPLSLTVFNRISNIFAQKTKQKQIITKYTKIKVHRIYFYKRSSNFFDFLDS